jgi:hypothetical protein
MHSKLLVGLVVVLVGFLLTPASGNAQGPALSTAEQNTFADLDVRIGDTLIVKTWDDPKMTGILVSLGTEQLTLAVDGTPVTLPANDVQRIQRKRMSWILGTVIGAGAGLGLGALSASIDMTNTNPAGPMISGTLFGAAIGLGIDALINIPHTVYQREVRVTVAPVVTQQAAGIQMHVAF